MISSDKINFNIENFKLICLSILALDIPLELSKIPENKNELHVAINLIFNTLMKSDELIRRASSLLEQIEQQEDHPEGYYGLVADYLNKFREIADNHPVFAFNLAENEQEGIALKLLTNLLFYSGKNGFNFLQEQLT